MGSRSGVADVLVVGAHRHISPARDRFIDVPFVAAPGDLVSVGCLMFYEYRGVKLSLTVAWISELASLSAVAQQEVR